MKTNDGDQPDTVSRSGEVDAVLAELYAVRDAYSAEHGHDVAAIFADIRARQAASGRTYYHFVDGRLVPVTAENAPRGGGEADGTPTGEAEE